METKLFQSLRREIKRGYGFTKKSIKFIPFENWRNKLRTYANQFDEEYIENLALLRRKLKINNLQEVKNPNKKLIFFIGIPGAGKTTLAKIIQKSVPNTILLRGVDVVDALHLFDKRKVNTYKKRLKARKFNNPDPWYISYLYQEHLIRDCLKAGYNVVFDDHIRTRANRFGYYKLARQFNSKIVFIQINASFKTYVEREEGKVNDAKLKFLANMILQSEDLSEEERRKYDKIIIVDGTSKLGEIKRYLLPKIKKA